jgi:hypothetical protein
MGVLAIILLIKGIMMLIEGSVAIFLPKYSLKFFRRFSKSVEKNIKSWGIVEVILAIILIIFGFTL